MLMMLMMMMMIILNNWDNANYYSYYCYIVKLLLLALRHMRFSEADFVRDNGFVVQKFFERDKWFHGGMTGPTVPMGNVSPCFTFWQWMKPLKPSMMLKLRIPRIPRIPRTHSDRIWQWIWPDMINKSFEPTSTPQNIQAQFPGYSFNRRSCGGGWQHGGHFESQTDSASNRDCGFTEFVDGSVIAGKLRIPHNRVDNIICMRYKDIFPTMTDFDRHGGWIFDNGYTPKDTMA